MPPLHPQCHTPHQAVNINNWTIAKLLHGLLVSRLALYPCIIFSILLLDLFKMQTHLHTHFTLLKAHHWFPVVWAKNWTSGLACKSSRNMPPCLPFQPFNRHSASLQKPYLLMCNYLCICYSLDLEFSPLCVSWGNSAFLTRLHKNLPPAPCPVFLGHH